ncbi:ABC transporter ATP-binding protein [Adhaeretor mobilis]|uniref:Lipoprotein-releasing system ATP-binding protein LolD n=1 Tax=Adhaeretor mobilis TaxID=1930276 RepID=A0A517MTK4_9BACT|nr:ABC transporter ATP-binding protein [Adhaeretor mobilis]QDS98218.1 Lipoprotein-releasing system ATP-binding protein LolD [Adhaeretor mobilis]
MITLEQVTKHYRHRQGEVVGLNGIDLTINSGEFISLTGPSGSGKSTLLLMLGTMMSPTAGRVLVDDTSVYDLCVARRTQLRRSKIGFVFQTFNLIPYLTALQNVQLPLTLTGKPIPAQVSRASELLERVGLAERMDHKPSELSIGQQQRVALARTLANDPEIILADEPTGNLDPDTRTQILEFFEEFNREGKTVVIVTHDPAVAEMAHRTVRIVEGHIVHADMASQNTAVSVA